MQDSEKKPFESLRDAMLSIYDIGEEINGQTLNAFGYALRLCKTLSANIIDSNQFELLSGSMKMYCDKIGEPTSLSDGNVNINLF